MYFLLVFYFFISPHQTVLTLQYDIGSNEFSTFKNLSNYYKHCKDLIQVKFISANETYSCLNSCRYTDPDLDVCWYFSLKHRTEKVISAVKDLYSILLHIHHWRTFNEVDEGLILNEIPTNKNSNDLNMTNRSIPRSNKNNELFISEDEDVMYSMVTKKQEEGGISGRVHRRILSSVYTEYKRQRHLYDDHPFMDLPAMTCPTPCDYSSNIWLTNFLISLACNIILITFIFLSHLRMMHKSGML